MKLQVDLLHEISTALYVELDRRIAAWRAATEAARARSTLATRPAPRGRPRSRPPVGAELTALAGLTLYDLSVAHLRHGDGSTADVNAKLLAAQRKWVEERAVERAVERAAARASRSVERAAERESRPTLTILTNELLAKGLGIAAAREAAPANHAASGKTRKK